jgi:hypothetical protein
MGGRRWCDYSYNNLFWVGEREEKRVRWVIETIRVYASRGITYKGQMFKGKGRKPIVTSPQEYQILIDSMEQGLGLVTAVHQINEYREEDHLPEARLSTVHRTVKRLKPVIRKVRRRKQGNRDPNSILQGSLIQTSCHHWVFTKLCF